MGCEEGGVDIDGDSLGCVVGDDEELGKLLGELDGYDKERVQINDFFKTFEQNAALTTYIS